MFLDLSMCKKDLNTNSYPFPLLQLQFGLFLTHNILTSDDPSTDEETSTTDNILTSDDPSTDEETSTTDNILTSDDPSTDEETSTTDNILTSDYPSTDEEISTTDEGDNTTTMYIHVFYRHKIRNFLYLCEFL
jgi:hypothetical protein